MRHSTNLSYLTGPTFYPTLFEPNRCICSVTPDAQIPKDPGIRAHVPEWLAVIDTRFQIAGEIASISTTEAE